MPFDRYCGSVYVRLYVSFILLIPIWKMGTGKAGPVVTDNGGFIVDAIFAESYMKDPSEVRS